MPSVPKSSGFVAIVGSIVAQLRNRFIGSSDYRIIENLQMLHGLAQVRHGRGKKQGKWFGISSGYLRVCTTFLIKTEAVGEGDPELVEQLFLCRAPRGD